MRRIATRHVDDASDVIRDQEVGVEDCVEAGQCDRKPCFLIYILVHEDFISVVFVRTRVTALVPGLNDDGSILAGLSLAQMVIGGVEIRRFVAVRLAASLISATSPIGRHCKYRASSTILQIGLSRSGYGRVQKLKLGNEA